LVKVFINGAWVGITKNPIELYTSLKEKKYKGIINIYTSIVFDYKNQEITVCNDAGRLIRPLLKVSDNKIIISENIIDKIKEGELSWDDLLSDCKIDKSVIEYIDPLEQSFSMVAMDNKQLNDKSSNFIYRYTHREIHPSTIFGILASCIPFPEHNQAPRLTYQCLDINEVVWMSNGTKQKIKDVKIGDSVITFDPDTLDITDTKVVNHFIRPNDNPIYKLITISGREIIATSDHKFMTERGWKTVQEMIDNKDIRICITMTDYPNKYDPYNFQIIEYLKIIHKCLPNNNLDNIDKNDLFSLVEFLKKEGVLSFPLAVRNNCMFQPVQNIILQPDGLVADIEVESKNHSFIAGNNFTSSNCAMGKQAMGVYVTNYTNRMDKTAYVHTYGMRPLVDTRVMDLIKLNTIPSGCQVIVAIMTYSGYNQEDSILFNKESIDRGLFQATIYHTEKDEDKKIHGDQEIRCRPDPSKTKGMKFGNYDKVNENGVIPENTLIEDRDIIIAKVLPIKENRNNHTKVIKNEDQSRIYRTNEEVYVDKNYIEHNGDGYNFAKVRMRCLRKPVIGDKFCLREESFVLTNKGWIQLKDIDIKQHKVATLKDGKNLDYVYPINKYEFDCDKEQLYHMYSQQINIICTKNHNLYIQRRDTDYFEFIQAKDVYGKRVKYKKDAINLNNDINEFVLENTKYNMDEFLKLLGSFISDGWVEIAKKYTRINISMTKTRKKIYIEEVLNKLNINYNMTKDRVLIGNTYKELVNYLNVLSVGAANKYLPEFVWNLSQRQSIILMESLLQGDGSYNKQGSCGYYTSSSKLADDIQKLALHCGWSGTIKLYDSKIKGSESIMLDGRIIKANYDNLSVRIVKNKNTPQVNHGDVKDQNIQKEEYIEYTGKVSCIEVPETHLFYYKEDNYSPPCWTGNSSRHRLLCRKASCPINLGS
jgi:intein/homing endonuclease